MAGVIRIAAVDDDRMLRDGLHRWLGDVEDLRLVTATATVDDLLGADTGPLDVVLLDLVLSDGSDPISNVRRLVDAGYRTLVISVWSEREAIATAFAAGASGYLTKDHDLTALVAAVREVAAGGTVYSPELAFACLRDPRPRRPRLSPREQAVLVAYASGMTLDSAARHIGVRPETARTYLDRVKAKYQQVGRPALTKLELANRAREDALAGVDPGPLGGSDPGPTAPPEVS